ncbi:NADP-dependent oxidoreductase domain-containing protein [Bombardia bombarda]|uniref:NADP-dependent oxidoreductase domain-containing protein n=1 Tax=Bombardia bombarda TaxID=252184 RepID=A0AA39XJX1_9PEZI|nr:NADP-dependent oxidoreductase domain-containing protein [Bombardia bombarda]
MSSVHMKPLGRNGPLVSRIGFGTMGLGIARTAEPIPDEQRLALLDRAHELGCTFWDSSDFYGDTESLIGKWCTKRGKRSDIFIATKFGATYQPQPDGSTGFTFRGDAAYVPIACEASLKRLGVDYIDLYYPHRVDGSTPIEHIVQEMVKLKEAGKIHHLGLSEVSATTLRRAHAVHPIACVQMEYSLFSTEIEHPQTQLLATCRELGVAVVAYCPLSRGLLTGSIQSPDDFAPGDQRVMYPRYSRENFPKNNALVGAIKGLAEKRGNGVTVGQVALAWLLEQGDDIFPIPGTIQQKYLEENWGALEVDLTAEEAQEIRRLVEEASVFGHRYPVEYQLAMFADTPALE